MRKITDKRYKDFTYLDEPTEFCELFKDQNYDVVQVHDTTPITGLGSIIGFAGQFEWKNNKLTPLDGDSYTSHMIVIGYNEFSHEGLKCLDVLSEDW